MACDSPRIWAWARIPDGSHLVICVRPEDGGTDDRFDATAILDADVPDPADDRFWDHADLTSCTLREPLSVPRRYLTTVTLAFQGTDPCGAVIEARIEKPDGETHGTPYCRSVSNAEGAIERCHLLISMSLS